MSDTLEHTQKPKYLKISPEGGKDMIINENFIRYVKRDNNCFLVCSKFNGCDKDSLLKVCKHDAFESWTKLNKYFNE